MDNNPRGLLPEPEERRWKFKLPNTINLLRTLHHGLMLLAVVCVVCISALVGFFAVWLTGLTLYRLAETLWITVFKVPWV